MESASSVHTSEEARKRKDREADTPTLSDGVSVTGIVTSRFCHGNVTAYLVVHY